MNGAEPYRGQLEGNAEREGTSITELDVETDPQGGIRRLNVSLDRDTAGHHDAIRLSIFSPDGLLYDEIVLLDTGQTWFDLVDHCREAGVPLPDSGIDEPGMQVRVAPFDHGRPLESREVLAMEVTLDAPSGSPRQVVGAWEAKWPGSLWLCGVVTGHAGALRRAFAICTDEIFELGVVWRAFRTGEADHPLIDSWVGERQAAIVWETKGFACLDLTADLATVAWSDLADAVLEVEALSAAAPDARPRALRMPLTAR